jgi:hypothetical protein
VDRKTFDGSMTRLMGFYKLPVSAAERAHFTTYMDSLYEAVQRMDPFLFESVTKELSKSLSRGQRPVPSQFYAVYEKLRDQQPKKLEKCESCGSTGFVHQWAMNHETAENAEFAKPCPTCRPRHMLQNAPLRPGWVELDVPPPKPGPTQTTKNFLEDFYGIKADTPEEALEMVTQMWREGKFNLRSLVNVVASKVERERISQKEAIAKRNKMVEDLQKSGPPREAAPSGAVGSGAPENYEVEE